MTSSSLKSTVTGDIHYCRVVKAMTPWPCEDSGTLHFIACKAHITEDRAVFTVRRSIGFIRKRKLGGIGGCKQTAAEVELEIKI